MAKQEEPTEITEEQMNDAINRSGYPLEARVALILNNTPGFSASSNPVYQDPITGKTREYDVHGFIFEPENTIATTRLHIECVNNKFPFIFFNTKESGKYDFCDTIRCFSPINSFRNKNGSLEHIIPGLTEIVQDIEFFHHYSEGLVASQWFSFKWNKEKKIFIALHEDDYFDKFDNIINAVSTSIDSYRQLFSGWVGFHVQYPVIVMQNKLLCAAPTNAGGYQYTEVDYMKLKLIRYQNNARVYYMLDIVTEKYLSSYLSLVLKSHESLRDRVYKYKKELINEFIVNKYNNQGYIPNE